MRWIRNRRKRAAAALAAALLAACAVNTGVDREIFLPEKIKTEQGALDREKEEQALLTEEGQNITVQYAWWGTMYPKFCFSQKKNGKLKISFWLAKAFNWC